MPRVRAAGWLGPPGGAGLGRTAVRLFTLLFEALVLALCQQMTFTGVARLVNLSLHRVMAICSHYVEQAVAEADFSEVRSLAHRRDLPRPRHDYVTLAADAQAAGGHLRHRRARCRDHQGAGRRPSSAWRRSPRRRVGEHRYVAGLHQGVGDSLSPTPALPGQFHRWRTFDGPRPDALPRADRSAAQGTALDAAQGSPGR